MEKLLSLTHFPQWVTVLSGRLLARKVLCMSGTAEGVWLRKSFVWRVVVVVAGVGVGGRGWLGDAADDRALP